MANGAYSAVQMSRPRSLTLDLNDSPVVVASWILDRFPRGRIPATTSKNVRQDDPLTNITLYWATQTIGSSIGRGDLPGQLPCQSYRLNKGVPYGIFIRHRPDCRPKVGRG